MMKIFNMFCENVLESNLVFHSVADEESHVFLFKSKNQKRDPSDFVLRMTRKGKFAKILEHS
jgi:hypothetical protein